MFKKGDAMAVLAGRKGGHNNKSIRRFKADPKASQEALKARWHKVKKGTYDLKYEDPKKLRRTR